MDVTITNAGGRIEIVDLRNDLTNNYDVLKDGLRLFNLGNIVQIIFANQIRLEISADEVELINGGTSILPRDGSEFLAALNNLLGDYGTGGTGEIPGLQDVLDVSNRTETDINLINNAAVLFENNSKVKEGTTDAGLGGAKGVALICSINYEFKWEAGRLYVMEQDGFTIRETRYNFNNIPNEFDDITKGYVPNSKWILDNGNLYKCIDNTINAAVWALGTTGGGDMLKSVYDTDNDGSVDKAETVQIIVRNSTGSTLTKGQIVYLSGATGNRPNAVLSRADAESTSSKTIGWVTENINNNSDGYIGVSGSAHDLDTSAFAAGDALWLSATVSGGMTSTIPVQPNHAVFIGYCARSHPNQGRIVFKIQNGYELNELHNVLISSVANNNVLTYESSSQLWKNKTIDTALGFTPVTNARTITTNAPLSGGGDLSGNLTLSISEATYSQSGYLNSTDWNVFNNKALNYKNTVDTAGYSGITNTAVYTQLIPANKFSQGDIIRIIYRTKKTGILGTQILRIYVNSAASLSGSPVLIATYTNSGAISFLTNQIQRHLAIKSNTNNTEVFLAAGTAVSNDFGLYNGLTNAVIDWTLNRYFVFAIQSNSVTDVNYGSMFLIEKL
jgi:hypothetical protein